MKFILDAIFPPRESELRVRACTADSLLALLSPRVMPGEAKGAVGLVPYAHVDVQACVLETKFHGNAQAARLLGQVLREYLIELSADSQGFSAGAIVLVPIPLSRTRSRERGYNQTERIARYAVAGLEDYIEIETNMLVRTRDTLPQTALGGDARRQNIKGAFGVAHPCEPSRTYIVFDDVLTTGATLASAVEALKNSSAQHIVPLALAY